MCEDNGIILITIVRWNKIEVTGTGVLDSDLGKKKKKKSEYPTYQSLDTRPD